MFAVIIVWAIVCVITPLLGLFLSGVSVSPYLEFPPTTQLVEHPGSRWAFFCVLALAIFFYVRLHFFGLKEIHVRLETEKFLKSKPLFFFCALVGVWVIAWQRFPMFSFVQEHTFFFLWIAYILFCHFFLISLGRISPLSVSAQRQVMLFAMSASFWWIFEWLNRFVQNWSYRNVESYSPLEYFFLATLSFSTVLPATLVTRALIEHFVLIDVHPASFSKNLFSWVSSAKTLVMLLSLVVLGVVGMFPTILFPMLWIAPLLLLQCLTLRRTKKTFITLTSENDFRELSYWSLSGIWCGFLWELWNFKSFAGWEYSIPYVSQLRVFEMPLLGYAGYLPFGVLCGLVCSLSGFASQGE